MVVLMPRPASDRPPPPRRGGRRLRAAVAAAVLAMGALAGSPASVQSDGIGSDISAYDRMKAREFAGEVLEFATRMRDRGITYWDVPLPHGGGGEFLAVMDFQWRRFFDNMGISFGRLRSPTPIALFYNPLLDIGLLTYWERRIESHAVTSAILLPGERLENPDGWAHSAMFASAPPWMEDENDMLAALARSAASRVEAFHAAHPVKSREPARDELTFAEADQLLRAVMRRLATWYEQQRSIRAWWVRPVESEIASRLAARNPMVLMRAAPDTDPLTANALARVSEDAVTRFTLHMVLDVVGDGHRLLLGSLRDTLSIIPVTCLLSDGGCNLRRFQLMDLQPTGASG